jgi:exopolysaccharide production protein ExoZ
MSRELISVQYLRGIAASMVVVHHLLSTAAIDYMFIPSLGKFGVQIFFVISGFIMWHTTAATEITVLEFWRRRIIRILPLYWIFLALLIIGALGFPRLFHTTVITPDNVVKSFLFIPHFHMVQTGLIAPILIPGWSLNYEMYFYFLFGLAMLIESRAIRAAVLGGSLSGLVVLGYLYQPTDALVSTYTSSELLGFLDGVILAIIYRSGWLRNPMFGSVLVAAGLLLAFGAPPISHLTQFDDFFAVSAALIVAGSLALEAPAQIAPSRTLLAVGNASYSIYLSHLFWLRLAELIWQRSSLFGLNRALDALYIVFALTISIAGGIAVHHFVELPILRLGTRRRPAVVAEVA